MAAMIIPARARPSSRRSPTLFPHSPGPYIALMLAGFAIGILGHLTKARWMIASGVVLIFLGALLFPLAANLTTREPAAADRRNAAATRRIGRSVYDRRDGTPRRGRPEPQPQPQGGGSRS